MIWVIEFRSGTYLQSLDHDNSGPLVTAMRFNSQVDADSIITHHPWVALNGGMAKLMRASRYTDLDEQARQLLMVLAEGGDGTAMSVMMGHALIKSRLFKLAEQIWTQGWDCREEQGPLAGAFGHANRYNPYRRTPEPPKCRSCGAQPMHTERGRCEDCGDCQGCGGEGCHQCHDEIIASAIKGSDGLPGDAVAAFQVFPEKEIPLEDVVLSIEKLREAPIPTLGEEGDYWHERCGICMKSFDDCDCAQAGRR